MSSQSLNNLADRYCECKDATAKPNPSICDRSPSEKTTQLLQTNPNATIELLHLPALPTTATKYGQKYQIMGYLTGINDKKLWIKTIGIVTATETKFVTLFPN